MNKYLIYIFTAIILGCSSVPPMEVSNFAGISTIKKGDSTQLKWDFANAYYVEIDGVPTKFKSNDSLVVSPEESYVYKFKAIQDSDTISRNWRVVVMIPEKQQKMQQLDYGTSYTESNYFKGVMDNAKIIAPKKLKITSVKLDEDNDKIDFSGLIIDEFGNYISGLTGDNKLTWEIKQKCNNNESDIVLNDYSEIIDNEEPLNLYLMIDKSAAAEYLSGVEKALFEFYNILSKNDRVSISTFDQSNDKIIENARKKELMDLNIDLTKSKGLNAIYKNSFETISEFKKIENKKAIVIINFSSNNAATIYNISDVINESRVNDIPIYVISIGDANDSFSSKYLSYSSGGAFYDISVNKLYHLTDVLNEIYFSQKAHYNFTIPYSSLADCNYDGTQITAEFNEKSISDKIYVVKKPEWLGSKSQSIALFDYKSDKLSNEFDILIESMARVLEDNPDFDLELIGHSSIEGSESTNKELSFHRAEAVASKLISYGADENQIRIKALGSSQPIYFLPNSAWQQYYNRRVDVRWLIPEMLPYELVVEEFWTEEEAITNVVEWKNKGFQSYYERFLVENMPKYKTKLWGYRSEEAAKEDISLISSKYNIKARLE